MKNPWKKIPEGSDLNDREEPLRKSLIVSGPQVTKNPD